MAAPTATWAVDATGLLVTATWSESLNDDASPPTLTLSVAGDTQTSGDVTAPTIATRRWVMSRTIPVGVTVTASLAAAAVTSLSTSDPNAVISGASVTNNSIVFPGCSSPARGLMRNTCTIQRKTQAQSANGSVEDTWADYRTSVCCSVQGDNTREALNAMRETGERTYRGYFCPALDIRNGDRISSVSGPGAMSGVTLEVTGPPLDHAGAAAYVMVTLREVKGGPTT